MLSGHSLGKVRLEDFLCNGRREASNKDLAGVRGLGGKFGLHHAALNLVLAAANTLRSLQYSRSKGNQQDAHVHVSGRIPS